MPTCPDFEAKPVQRCVVWVSRFLASVLCVQFIFAVLSPTPSLGGQRQSRDQAAGGLNLGLWTRKADSIATADKTKPIYGVFKAADTQGEDVAFEFALPLIGLENWETGVPMAPKK